MTPRVEGIGNGTRSNLDAAPISSAAHPATPASATEAPPTIGGIGEFLKGLTELREYALLMLSCKFDGLLVKVRSLLVATMVYLLLLFMLCVWILIGSVLLFAGLAQGLGVLFGQPLWVGCLATGLLLLGGLPLGLYAALAIKNRRSKERTVLRYEQRKASLRARFDHGAGPLQ